jgi:hypothetical protein
MAAREPRRRISSSQQPPSHDTTRRGLICARSTALERAHAEVMTRLVIVGGSDAGISAALSARELDPGAQVDLLPSDRWPNYSICGLPYLISGEVADTADLAHRTQSEIQAAGIDVRVEHHVVSIDAERRAVLARDSAGATVRFDYDALILATGAVPQRPPIAGLDLDGVHLLHTVDDSLTIADRLAASHVRHAVIVGAGYIGLEMADALRHREVDVTLVERLPEVMRTIDAQIGAQVRETLTRHGVRVPVDTEVSAVEIARDGLRSGRAPETSLPTSCSWSQASAPMSRSAPSSASPPGLAAHWRSTTTWPPGSPAFGRRVTASTPTTDCAGSPATCRSAPRRTSKGAWQARTR